MVSEKCKYAKLYFLILSDRGCHLDGPKRPAFFSPRSFWYIELFCPFYFGKGSCWIGKPPGDLSWMHIFGMSSNCERANTKKDWCHKLSVHTTPCKYMMSQSKMDALKLLYWQVLSLGMLVNPPRSPGGDHCGNGFVNPPCHLSHSLGSVLVLRSTVPWGHSMWNWAD